MYWSRQRLKEMAKVALRGSYWKCVLVSLILTVATGASINQTTRVQFHGGGGDVHYNLFHVSGPLILFFIGGALVGSATWIAFHLLVLQPAEVGCCAFFNKDLYAPAELDEMKKGFMPNYWNVVKVQLFRVLYTFLWSLLFIVPGIIKSYEYRMIPYILAENPNIEKEEAFARSKAMMDGEKWNTFILDLSFIGWFLLSGITCGVLAIFYVDPYYYLTNAALYGALKRKMGILAAGGGNGSGDGNGTAGFGGGSSTGADFSAGSSMAQGASDFAGAQTASNTSDFTGGQTAPDTSDFAGSTAASDATGFADAQAMSDAAGTAADAGTSYSQDATDFTGSANSTNDAAGFSDSAMKEAADFAGSTAGDAADAAGFAGSTAGDATDTAGTAGDAANAENLSDDVQDAPWVAYEQQNPAQSFGAGAGDEARGADADFGADDEEVPQETTTEGADNDVMDAVWESTEPEAAGADETQADASQADSTWTSPFDAEPVLKPETPEPVKTEGPVDAPWVIYAQSQSSSETDEAEDTPAPEAVLTPESAAVEYDSAAAVETEDAAAEADGVAAVEPEDAAADADGAETAETESMPAGIENAEEAAAMADMAEEEPDENA